MNRLLRVLPAFVALTAAMLSSSPSFADSASAKASRETTRYARGGSSYSGPAVTLVKHGNGTTEGFLANKRIVTPYGKHAQASVQTRDDKGRFLPAGIAKIDRFKNGTTISHNHDGTRTVQPYGKHAQPLVQERGSDGRWLKAVASKVWGQRTWAKSSSK